MWPKVFSTDCLNRGSFLVMRAGVLTFSAFFPGYEMMVTKANMVATFDFWVFRAEGMNHEQPSGKG